METSSQHKTVGTINIPSITEESLGRSLSLVESPYSKRRVETDFPTESTLHLRSPNSPHTASSTLPFPKETFYDKVKDSLLNNRLTEKLRHLRQKSESLRISSHNEKMESIEGMGRYTEAHEPYELEINKEIPTLIWCAYCQGERKTELNYINSSKTFWSSVGIFMAGGVVGCFLFPYFTNKCKSKQLVCSKCGHALQ